MDSKNLKVNDRVKRVKARGCQGIVRDVRHEITAASEQKEKPLIVTVQWDNGTLSHFSPEALEVVEGRSDQLTSPRSLAF